MAALVRSMETMLTEEQSMQRTISLLAWGRDLRYIVVDEDEKGLTFAVEPTRFSLQPDSGVK